MTFDPVHKLIYRQSLQQGYGGWQWGLFRSYDNGFHGNRLGGVKYYHRTLAITPRPK